MAEGRRLCRVLTLALALAVAIPSARAAPAAIGYGGRLTDATGAPLAGPVDLSVQFYGSASGGTGLLARPLEFPATKLADGVFQLQLSLTPAQLDAVFRDGSEPVYVGVTDVTHEKSYPRQALLAVPFALKVPVDGTSVVYDGSGKLSVGAVDAAKVTGLSAMLADMGDAAKLQGVPLGTGTPAAGAVLKYVGGQWQAVAGDSVSGNFGIGTTSAQTALDVAGVLTQRAGSLPAVAPPGEGRIYFDSSSNQFMVSQNGGAYAPLGTVTAGAITQVSAGAGMTGGGTAGNVTLGLASVGTAGTYTRVLTDAHGRVTAGGSLTAADLPPLNLMNGTLAATQVAAIPATQISGTFVAAQIPSLPLAQMTGTLAAAQVASIPSTQMSGTLTASQLPLIPVTQLSGTLTTAQLPSLSAAQLTSGTLSVALGGTGATSFANNGVIVGGGAGPLSATAAGTQYQVLTVNGANQPVFGALNLDRPAAVTGTLAVASGGTGSGAPLTGNRLMVSTAGAIVEAPSLVDVGGSVGIGTTSPAGQLDVVSASAGTVGVLVEPSSAAQTAAGVKLRALSPSSAADSLKLELENKLSSAGNGSLTLRNAQASGAYDQAKLRIANSTFTIADFYTQQSGFDQGRFELYNPSTAAPGLKLYVNGTGNGAVGSITTDGQTLSLGANDTVGNVLTTTMSGTSVLGINALAPVDVGVLKVRNGRGSGNALEVENTSGSPLTVVDAAGKVAIGASSAGSALDVAGAVSMRGMPAPAAAPASQARLYYDSGSQQLMLSQDGSGYAPLSSGGTITGVTAGTGLTGGGSTGAVTLALPSVGAAGAYTKVLTDAQGRVTFGSTLTAADLPPHSAALVTSGTLPAGVIPGLPASQITSGTLALSLIPSYPVAQLTGTLAPSQVPQLPASQLTGTVAAAQLTAAGSPGQVQFNAGGLPAADASLFWDNTAKRLGVGTPTPGQKLSVAGTIESTSGGFRFPDGTTQTSAAAAGSAGSAVAWVAFNGTNGAILSSFNVSSVTRTSAGRYVVNFATALADTNYAVIVSGSNTGNNDGGWQAVDQYAGSAKTTTAVKVMHVITGGSYGDDAELYVAVFQGSGTAPVGSGQWTENGASVYRASGNVGIGTTSPSAKLEVNGSVTIDSGGSLSINSNVNSAVTMAFGGTANEQVLVGPPNQWRWLNNAGSQNNFVFTDGGNLYVTRGSVGVGSTTPQAKLDVAGEVRVGSSGLACGAATSGAVRYNAGTLEFCNGSAWVDTTPSGSLCGMRNVICSGTSLTYDNASTNNTPCKGNTLTTTCSSGSIPTGTVGCPSGYTGVFYQGGANGSYFDYLMTCAKN